jgi:precorrin-6B methylase 2
MSDRNPTPDALLQLGLGFWASKALLTAVELDLVGLLAERPHTAMELMTCLGLQARGTRDWLDALVSMGVLERSGDTYANGVEAATFLDPRQPSYVGGLLQMANARLYPFWGSLTEALRTGLPQNEAKVGGDFFSALYQDPERLEQFLHAMTGISLGSAQAIAEKFPWQQYSTVVDVGAAEGCLPVELVHRHPHLTGAGFDLPAVAPFFEKYVAANGLTDRLHFVAGDFFTDPIPDADVLVMGHILHDWGFYEKQLLLRKAYEALPSGGALIVYESVIDDDRRTNTFALLMSVNMLIETREGFDYTGAECQAWLADAGFRRSYVEPLVGPDSMVVGIK